MNKEIKILWIGSGRRQVIIGLLVLLSPYVSKYKNIGILEYVLNIKYYIICFFVLLIFYRFRLGIYKIILTLRNQILNLIPFKIVIINKMGNAHLNTRDRGVWSYKIRPFSGKEIPATNNFHTEESLIDYLKRNGVHIIKPLGESKYNDMILKSYLVKFPDTISFIHKMISDTLEQ